VHLASVACYRQETPPGSGCIGVGRVLSTGDPSGVQVHPGAVGCYRQETPPGSRCIGVGLSSLFRLVLFILPSYPKLPHRW